MSDDAPTEQELCAEARQYVPDFVLCRRCGRPLWDVESIITGIGRRCLMLEVCEQARQYAPRPALRLAR